jgi:hypothetical protein
MLHLFKEEGEGGWAFCSCFCEEVEEGGAYAALLEGEEGGGCSGTGLLAQWLASNDPITLWVQALNAQGTATRGSLKWREASTAPSVLFCMPTCSRQSAGKGCDVHKTPVNLIQLERLEVNDCRQVRRVNFQVLPHGRGRRDSVSPCAQRQCC